MQQGGFPNISSPYFDHSESTGKHTNNGYNSNVSIHKVMLLTF